MPLGWIVILGAVWLAVGLGLLGVGLFGRRSPLAAVCRRCRFDLTASGDAPVCPECGADVVAPRAVLRHPFIRRRWMIALGAVLLLVLFGAGGAAWWVQARPNLNRIKPGWLLVMEAQNAGPPTAVAALTELNARQLASALSSSVTQELITTALDRQADPNAIWLPEWGAFIESARAAGSIDDERWADYVVRAANIRCVARERGHAGGRHTGYIEVGGGRMSQSYRIASLQIARLGPLNPTATPQFIPSVSWGGSSSSSFLETLPEQIGPHTIHVDLQIAVAPFGDYDPASAVGSRTRRFEIPVQVVPPDQPLVTLSRSDALDAAVRRSLKSPEVTVRRHGSGGRMISVMFNVNQVPIACAFTTTYRWTNKDGSAHEQIEPGPSFRKGASGGYGRGLELRNFDADMVDMVLTTDIKVAEADPFIDEIWDGTLEFREVKVAPEQQYMPQLTDPG